jgi:hypothetical protein
MVPRKIHLSLNYLQDKPRKMFGKIGKYQGLARYGKIEQDSILLYLVKAFLSFLPNNNDLD